ncbi:MAG: YceD family protein [Jatrophihabitans sp.]
MGRRTGSSKDLRWTVPAPTGLDLDVVGVSPGTPVELDLRLESVTEGVLVTGIVTAPTEGECSRCLDPVQETCVVDIMELYVYPDSTTDETTDEDEVPRLVDDLIDLEPAVRDAVVLGLPLTPLCRPDCPGLCPQCGQGLADLPTDHSHEQIDPRWAGLADVSEQLRTEQSE